MTNDKPIFEDVIDAPNDNCMGGAHGDSPSNQLYEMTDSCAEIRRRIERLRHYGEAVQMQGSDGSCFFDSVEAMEKLLAVYEAAQDVRYSGGSDLAMSVLTDALEAVQTRRDDDDT